MYSTAIAGIIAPLVAQAIRPMLWALRNPFATPHLNIGGIRVFEKFGALLELLHHQLAPSAKSIEPVDVFSQY